MENSKFNLILIFTVLSLIPLSAQENTSILCSDGIDNDGDGLTDCNDSQCVALPNAGCLTCFNDGLSFADYVIEYSQTCGTMNDFTIPEEALGVADDPLVAGSNKFVSLGDGGMLKLGFSDNLLINSGDDNPDIWVFEIGTVVESTTIELRPADPITISALTGASVLDSDGDGYYEFGMIMGSTASVDIEEFVPGFTMGILKFNAIKITDVPNIGCDSRAPGADIDAVCALSSVSSEVCDNGIDDDLDGFIDCDDPQLVNDCCCLVTTTIDLGSDITTCFGDTILLEVPDVFTSYTWNTGEVLPQLVVTTSGTYAITVGELNNCELVDSINIVIGSDPFIDRVEFKCPGEDIVVEGRTFQNPGIFFDTVFTTGVCDTFFRFEIIDYNLASQFLGEDQIICGGEFTIQSAYSLTNWPDGSVGREFTTSESGSFIATALDTAGCLLTDTINIQLDNLGQFYLPSAFSPNNDGVNESFQPLFEEGNNLEYTLTIYNRWGGALFERTGTSVAWLGRSSGKEVLSGTYLYKLSYTSDVCSSAQSYTGAVVLLR